MKLKKKSVAVVTSVALTAMLAACSGGGSQSTSGSASKDTSAKKNITVGFQVYGLKAQFASMLNTEMQKKAKELGVKLVTSDGNYDVSTAISQLQNFQTQQVNAIVVDPIDANALNATVNSVVTSGIPVIGVNAILKAEKLTSYVGSPDEIAGEMEAEQMAKALNGKGNIVEFEGPIGQSGQIERGKGIDNVLKKYPDIHIIEKRTANWSRDEAMSTMENWIQSHGKDINGVIGQNDEMALGALNALKEKGMKVPVVGVDGVKDALNAVKSGDMIASIFQNAIAQADQSLERAVDAANGKKLKKRYDVPFELVTKDNAQKYLDKYYPGN